MTTFDHLLKGFALVCMVFGLLLLGDIVTGGNNLMFHPRGGHSLFWKPTASKIPPVNSTNVIKFPVHYPNFRCETDGTNIFAVIYLSETNCVTNCIALLPKL